MDNTEKYEWCFVDGSVYKSSNISIRELLSILKTFKTYIVF